MKKNYFFTRPHKFATCRLKRGDVVIQPGLSITPSQMMDMAEYGIAISSQMVGSFYDGDKNPSWDIPAERVRGVDPGDLFELQGEVRRKVVAAHRKDVQVYGQ